jgi:hypothetical protein
MMLVLNTLQGKFLSNGFPLDHNCSWTTGNPVIFPLHFFPTEVLLDFVHLYSKVFKCKVGTSVLKSIAQVPINETGTVFEITGNFLIFTLLEKAFFFSFGFRSITEKVSKMILF